MRYLFTFFIVSTIILAQPSFTERTIEGDFNGANSVYAVDMDGDGDMDVVGAAYNDLAVSCSIEATSVMEVPSAEMVKVAIYPLLSAPAYAIA